MNDIATTDNKVTPNATYQMILLMLITLLATLLRFYKLGEWSFWGDELITVDRADNGFVYNGVFLKSVSTLLTALSLTLFGASEWAARLPAALAGIISIPVLYFPMRRIVGPGVALLAVLLLAVSPWHLYWSQNARFYTALLLFYTLSLFTFYLGLEEDRPLYLLLSLFFLGLAILERLSSLLLMPVIVTYLVGVAILPFEKPKGLRFRNLALFFSPGLVGGLLFALPFLRNPAMWWATMAWVNNNPFWLLAGVVYYIGIPTICIGGLGALYLLMKRARAALLFFLGAGVPLVLVMAISLFQYTANRYVFVTLLCWIILAALAAKELFLQTPSTTRLVTVGALSTLLFLPLSENLLYYQYQNGNRDDWKSAFAYIKEQKGPDDIVVVPNRLLGEYYLDKTVLPMTKVDLADLQAMNRRVWFIEDINVEAKWPHILQWMQENTLPVAQMDVHIQARNYKMRIYLYDPHNLPPVKQWAVSDKP